MFSEVSSAFRRAVCDHRSDRAHRHIRQGVAPSPTKYVQGVGILSGGTRNVATTCSSLPCVVVRA